MKKIIDGKLYNTDTAEELGHYWNGLGTNDFRNISESLYRTKNGVYFTAGSGGAMSSYARPCGNMTGGGEGIMVLCVDEAKEWAERHLTAEEYEAIFGQIEEA